MKGRPSEWTPVEKISRTANPVRQVFHALICALGWVVFGWYLYAVLLRPLEPDAVFTFLLLLLYAAGIALINFIWIRYNIDLSTKLTRRRESLRVEFTARTDKLGRGLEGADWPALRKAGRVWISTDEALWVKRYHASPPEVDAQETGPWNG